jgi:hypothetical protein
MHSEFAMRMEDIEVKEQIKDNIVVFVGEQAFKRWD